MSNAGQLHFELKLTSSSGEPIAGEDVRVNLDGDGSLAPRFSAKEVVRETGADGAARVTWHRAGIFGRDARATLTVTCDRDDTVLTLQALTPDQVVTGPRTSWVTERHTFGR
jgi:hypothetical protein